MVSKPELIIFNLGALTNQNTQFTTASRKLTKAARKPFLVCFSVGLKMCSPKGAYTEKNKRKAFNFISAWDGRSSSIFLKEKMH